MQAARAQPRQVVQPQAAADEEFGSVARFATGGGRRLGQQDRDAFVDPVRRTRREIRVQAGQLRELLAQRVAVGRAVDRPVERPAAGVQLRDEPFDCDEVRVAGGVEEAEYELVGALDPHGDHGFHQRVHVFR